MVRVKKSRNIHPAHAIKQTPDRRWRSLVACGERTNKRKQHHNLFIFFGSNFVRRTTATAHRKSRTKKWNAHKKKKYSQTHALLSLLAADSVTGAAVLSCKVLINSVWCVVGKLKQTGSFV